MWKSVPEQHKLRSLCKHIHFTKQKIPYENLRFKKVYFYIHVVSRKKNTHSDKGTIYIIMKKNNENLFFKYRCFKYNTFTKKRF